MHLGECGLQYNRDACALLRIKAAYATSYVSTSMYSGGPVHLPACPPAYHTFPAPTSWLSKQAHIKLEELRAA